MKTKQIKDARKISTLEKCVRAILTGSSIGDVVRWLKLPIIKIKK